MRKIKRGSNVNAYYMELWQSSRISRSPLVQWPSIGASGASDESSNLSRATTPRFSHSRSRSLILSFPMFSRKLLPHLFLFQILLSLQFLVTLKVRILLFPTHHAHVSTLAKDKSFHILKHCPFSFQQKDQNLHRIFSQFAHQKDVQISSVLPIAVQEFILFSGWVSRISIASADAKLLKMAYN